MKKAVFLLSLFIVNIKVFTQNVGIGTTTPTNKLHIEHADPTTDPLKVTGLRFENNQTNLNMMVIDTISGVVKRVQLSASGTDNQNIDSLVLNGNFLTVYIENGTPATVDLSSLTSSSGTDDQNIDSITLNFPNLTVYIENGSSASVDVSQLYTDRDMQNIDSLGLNGNILTVYIQNGLPASIDLTPLKDTGAGVINCFTPTSSSDFTSPNPANANKIWCIANNITVTGNVDFTGVPGIIFSDAGGIVDFGNYNVLFNDVAGWDFPHNRVVLDFSNGATIDSLSTFKNGDINLVNFGAKLDGDIIAGTGTDNFDLVREVQQIYNKTGGAARIEGIGVMMMRAVNKATFFCNDEPTGMYLTGRANLTLSSEAKIGTLPNNLTNYQVLTFWHSEYTFVRGGEIIGDLRNHTFSTAFDEGCHGIMVTGKSEYVDIETSVREFSGDGILSEGCYSAIINNVYGPDAIIEQSFQSANGGAKNMDISSTGAFQVNSDRSYSKLFPLTDPAFTDAKALMVGGHHAWGGPGGYKSNTIWIAFYDAGGTFIEKTEIVETYMYINLKPNYAQCRVVIENPDDWSALYGTIFSAKGPRYINYRPQKISYGVRQGISNVSPYSVVENIHFYRNGRRFTGQLGSPGWHIDIEDGYQKLNNITIRNNIFDNGARGDIILKGSKYVSIHDNIFPYYPEASQNINAEISLGNGHDSKFFNNIVRGRLIELGRRDEVYNNSLWDVTFIPSFENEMIRNHSNAYNFSFDFNTIDPSDELTYYKDNLWIYDKPLNNFYYVFRHGGRLSVVRENEVFDFQGNITSGNNRLSVAYNQTTPSLGYVNNVIFKNIKSDSAQAYYYGLDWPAQNMNKVESSIGLDIRTGGSQNIKLSNSKIEGWLRLTLTNFPTTNGGNSLLYDTYTIQNTQIKITSFEEVNYTTYALYTAAVDVNLFIENSLIDLNIGSAAQGNKILDLNHYGKTTFVNCHFDTERTGTTINLNNQASGDTVTFIDCNFGNNISVTLRPIDRMLYTKAHKDMPVYADNTAALAAGYPRGYLYRTPVGEVRMTF